MHPPQSTGIFIPANKKGLFILTFENMLLKHHNIIAKFGKINNNSCEVKFLFKKTGLPPYILQWHIRNAKKSLVDHLSKIEAEITNKSKKASTSPSPKFKDIINDESYDPVLAPCRLSLRSSNTIDLTGDSFQACEPEVILLDDCLDHTVVSKNSQKTIEIIDLDETSNSLPRKSLGNNIEVEGKKNFKPSICPNESENEVIVLKSFFGQNSSLSSLRRRKRRSNSFIETPKKSKMKKRTNLEERLSYYTPNDSKFSETSKSKVKESTRKKKKLSDVSNIIPTASSKTFPQNTKSLSDGVLKYYMNIGKAINKGKKKKSPKRKNSLKKVLSNKKSSLSPSVNKSKVMTPISVRKVYVPNLKNTVSPYSYNGQKVASYRSVKFGHESNIFNPNPNVDVEGLRPIAIDGSNVAVGHGKGSFSPKGLKICVDYFFNQGHVKVKVFLPLHRQDCFSKVLLEELRSKCDMVFTPSRLINGRQTTSYDDRFIVQYAVEFGAVIVSTDNFRDLLAENPRWTKAIQERLLMFTWIDDFLMFPMDPMGKNGPTLDEFLRF